MIKKLCCVVFQNILETFAEKSSFLEIQGKNVSGNFLSGKPVKLYDVACNLTLSKVFTILALSFLIINMTGFPFCFITEA